MTQAVKPAPKTSEDRPTPLAALPFRLEKAPRAGGAYVILHYTAEVLSPFGGMRTLPFKYEIGDVAANPLGGAIVSLMEMYRKLEADYHVLEALCDQLQVQARASDGETETLKNQLAGLKRQQSIRK